MVFDSVSTEPDGSIVNDWVATSSTTKHATVPEKIIEYASHQEPNFGESKNGLDQAREHVKMHLLSRNLLIRRFHLE
jgi:hypothetical protein